MQSYIHSNLQKSNDWSKHVKSEIIKGGSFVVFPKSGENDTGPKFLKERGRAVDK